MTGNLMKYKQEHNMTMTPYNAGNIFKYYPTERISFFDDFLIRFTQTEDLNDPAECLPKFKYFCDPGFKKERAQKTWERKFPDNKSESKRKHYCRQFIKTMNWKETIKSSYTKHLKMLGILSLSKSSLNGHLWENYAKDGFCIGFSSISPFFQRRSTDPQGTGELYEVTYDDTPIILDARRFYDPNFMQLRMFYQKTKKWELEEEIRIIRLRCTADNEIDNRFSLFRIQSDAITAVYFSPTASSKFIADAVAKIQGKLPNLPFFKVEHTNRSNTISGLTARAITI